MYTHDKIACLPARMYARTCTHTHRHILLQLQKVCTIYFDHNLIYNDYKYWLHMNKFDTLSYFHCFNMYSIDYKKVDYFDLPMERITLKIYISNVICYTIWICITCCHHICAICIGTQITHFLTHPGHGNSLILKRKLKVFFNEWHLTNKTMVVRNCLDNTNIFSYLVRRLSENWHKHWRNSNK